LLLKLYEPLLPSGEGGNEVSPRASKRVELELRPAGDAVAMAPEPEMEEEEPKVEPEVTGQLVDVPEPRESETPEDADYLAEHDRVVPEETRSEDFRINPEVLADQFSEEDRVEQQEFEDLDQTEPSTGATIGNNRFDPNEDGNLAALPSPFTQTNLEGLERPVPGGSLSEPVAGSPNNDRVTERPDGALQLNTKELLGASYINRIRRLVNFYWKQNLDNLPSSVLLVKPEYTTVLHVVLDGNGAVEKLEILVESGSSPLDRAVTHAFEVAGPFPNPPEQLIAGDGRVDLPEMHWTVNVGQARAPYIGVDPRQGVQFPGILKAPR